MDYARADAERKRKQEAESGYDQKNIPTNADQLKKTKPTVIFAAKPTASAVTNPDRTFKVAVNHFFLKVMDMTIYQYYIDIEHGLQEDLPAGRKRRIFQLVYYENKIAGLKCIMKKDDKGKNTIDPIASDHYITNGNQLFTTKNLFETEDMVEIDFVDHSKQNYKIKIKRTKVFTSNEEKPKEFWNLLMKKLFRNMKYKQYANKYFDISKQAATKSKPVLLLWPGYVASIAEHPKYMSFVVDLSYKIFQQDSVWDKIKNLESEAKQHKLNYKPMVEQQLIGATVVANYGTHMTWCITGISWNETPLNTFKIKVGRVRNQKTTSDEEIDISYKDYFAKQQGVTVTDDRQPLLNVEESRTGCNYQQKKIGKLVPNLVSLVGLPTKTIPRESIKNPKERMDELSQFLTKFNNDTSNQILKKYFGVKIQPQPEANAFVLQTPRVIFKNHTNLETSVKVNQGSWKSEIKNVHLLKQTIVKEWLCIYPVELTKKYDEFWNTFENVAKGLNCIFNRPKEVKIDSVKGIEYVKAFETNVTDKTTFVVLLLPDNGVERYSLIKTGLSCSTKAILSQCVVCSGKHSDRSVVTNIVLQVSAKLGNQLWKIQSNVALDNTLVVGIDVNHSKLVPSVVGFCATTPDIDFIYTEQHVQDGSGKEMFTKLQTSIYAALESYYNVKKRYPTRLLVYRDGISEGELEDALKIEVDPIFQIFDKLKVKCQLGFIIVNKRINTRILSQNKIYSKIKPNVLEEIQYFNPEPGTVVDTTIVSKDKYDFFMVAHSGKQGTVRPTHYTVIADTTGLSAEHMQQITYLMCHMYYGWSGTIAVPAQVKYAHKLAYYGGNVLNRKKPSEKLANKLYFL